MPAEDYFYYIDTTGYCSNGDFQLVTVGNGNYAKVCAWKPSLPNAVYGCDASPGVCWTSPQDCDFSLSTGNSSLGNGLQSCVRPNGSKWCCRDEPVERCGQTPTEPQICWAIDLETENPFRNVLEGNATDPQKAISILSSMGLTISSPTAGQVVTTATVTLSASQTDATLTPTHQGNSTLSGGAIAGVVIGALVGLGLIILGVGLILRRRRRRPRTTVIELPTTESVMPTEKDSGVQSSETYALHELSSSTPSELSGSKRDQRQELAS